MSFEKELIKLLIEHDKSPKHWIRDNKIDEMQMLISIMVQSGELTLDYQPGKETRYRVVEGTEIKDLDVDKFRQYFLSAYSGIPSWAGSKEEVTLAIKEYLAKHPEHNFELLCKAAKFYVDNTKADGGYLMKCINFIHNGRESTLEATVHDLLSNKSDESMSNLI